MQLASRTRSPIGFVAALAVVAGMATVKTRARVSRPAPPLVQSCDPWAERCGPDVELPPEPPELPPAFEQPATPLTLEEQVVVDSRQYLGDLFGLRRYRQTRATRHGTAL
jgi:hypothetical protein